MKYCLKTFTQTVPVLFIIVLLLSGCVSKSTDVMTDSTKFSQDLNSLQTWQLRGKIAWIIPNERKSAYINWQTQNNDIVFNLNNLLGVNLASLRTESSISTLTADGEEFVGESASLLIYQQTGIIVPIEELKSWVKGQIPITQETQSGLSSNIAYRPDGLIESYKFDCENCDVWNIKYDSYTQAEINQKTYVLPSSIELYNPAHQARIKIRISHWN